MSKQKRFKHHVPTDDQLVVSFVEADGADELSVEAVLAANEEYLASVAARVGPPAAEKTRKELQEELRDAEELAEYPRSPDIVVQVTRSA